MGREYSDKVVLVNIPFIGRCHFLKDTQGYICGGFIWFTWAYGLLVSMSVILLPRYYEGHISGFLIGYFLFVSAMVCASCFRCNTSNPGRIPLTMADHSVNVDRDYTMCRVCKVRRPQRSHHCSRCKQCVAKMDHHCPWVNNCVGQENHHHFLQLVHWAFAMGSSTMAFVPLNFYYWPACGDACDQSVWYHRQSLPLMHGLVALSLFIMLFMFCQLAQQHFNIIMDLTTLEGIINSPMEKMLGPQANQMILSAQGVPETAREFSSDTPSPAQKPKRSVLEKYRRIFPPGSPLLWWWPCRRRPSPLWTPVPPPV